MTDIRRSATLDPKLLDLLVCPLTKGPLDHDEDKNELVSKTAGLAYPIRDGIPIMLPSEARPLDDTVSAPGRGSRR
ncbi:MAG: Trm112 family protein [Alphaproteobacteria bacterium]|nr:Trm112 family protein [Alphaproteobacteria bacterium]